MQWSETALNSVASHFLGMQSQSQSFEIQEDKLQSIASICVQFHKSVEQISLKYLQETSRHFYVTPISYTKLLQNFEKMYSQKLKQLKKTRETYINGVRKLNDCNEIVSLMKVELEAMKPELIIKSQKTEEIMRKVEEETAEAEKQKENVMSNIYKK